MSTVLDSFLFLKVDPLFSPVYHSCNGEEKADNIKYELIGHGPP